MNVVEVLGFLFASVTSILLLRRCYTLRKEIHRLNAQIISVIEEYEKKLEDMKRLSEKMSRAVIKGQLAEQMFPLMKENVFAIQDMRFLGQPTDFIVFEGLSEGKVTRILFVEIKTGTSKLSAVQRSIRDTVERRQVDWRIIRLNFLGQENQDEHRHEDVQQSGIP